MHPAMLDPDSLLACCEVRRQRRSGPGGQHRNKVETGVFLTYRPTGTSSEGTEKRNQAENLVVALFRLRVNLALSFRCPADSPRDRPTLLWTSRCRGGRLQVNSQHTDFPALLAEALDAIHHFAGETKLAAEYLGTSHSQLIRFLKQDHRGLAEVNRLRSSMGKPPRL